MLPPGAVERVATVGSAGPASVPPHAATSPASASTPPTTTDLGARQWTDTRGRNTRATVAIVAGGSGAPARSPANCRRFVRHANGKRRQFARSVWAGG
jgi:hypothetical protein